MSKIEKMYENAGIEKVRDYYCPNCETKLEDWFGKHKGYICPNERCDYALCDDEEDFQECLEHLSYREKYPPFTAEKQLELIKWLGKSRPIHITFLCDEWKVESMIRYGKKYNTFENALCGYTATIWQDLTETEREEIRKILKG